MVVGRRVHMKNPDLALVGLRVHVKSPSVALVGRRMQTKSFRLAVIRPDLRLTRRARGSPGSECQVNGLGRTVEGFHMRVVGPARAVSRLNTFPHGLADMLA